MDTKLTFGWKRRRIEIPAGWAVLKSSDDVTVRPHDKFLNCLTGKFEYVDGDDVCSVGDEDQYSPTSHYACVIRLIDRESRQERFVDAGSQIHVDQLP